MANDFIVKVREAEQIAAEMLEKALKKKQNDLAKYKQTLASDLDNAVKRAKQEMNNDLQKTKIVARERYEDCLLYTSPSPRD